MNMYTKNKVMNEKFNNILKMLENTTLSTTVSVELLNEIEVNYKIVLPYEFKIFYSTISNGQISPYKYNRYKIHSIEKILKILEDKNKFYGVDLLNQKFEYVKPWIWGEEGSYELHQEAHYGSIEIANMGDGETWNLIVNGNSYGVMWNFTEWGITPCKSNLNFLDWFEKWFNQEEGFF